MNIGGFSDPSQFVTWIFRLYLSADLDLAHCNHLNLQKADLAQLVDVERLPNPQKPQRL